MPNEIEFIKFLEGSVANAKQRKADARHNIEYIERSIQEAEKKVSEVENELETSKKLDFVDSDSDHNDEGAIDRRDGRRSPRLAVYTCC